MRENSPIARPSKITCKPKYLRSQRASSRMMATMPRVVSERAYSCPELHVQVARKDLRVARLIHHLGGGIELGIHPGHGGGQLSGHKHGQLLPCRN